MSEILTQDQQNQDPVQPVTDPQQSVVFHQVGELQKLIKQGSVEDQQGFIRPKFELGDGISFVFRGREDTPTFESSGDTGLLIDVLTVDEKPADTRRAESLLITIGSI